MYKILVAHVCNSKLTPGSFLCPKELVETMRSIPLCCQIDERDVHEEGKPWPLGVLRRGGETQDPRGELRWAGLYAPPRYLTDRGGGKVDRKCPARHTHVRASTCRNHPSNLIGWSPLGSWPSAPWVPKTQVYYQAWRENQKLVDSYHWKHPDMELDSYGRRDGRKWSQNLWKPSIIWIGLPKAQ